MSQNLAIPSVVDQELHRAPVEFQRQQRAELAFIEAAEAGLHAGVDKVTVSPPDIATGQEVGVIRFPGLDQSLLHAPVNYVEVRLLSKDMAVTMFAIDVAVEDAQIALILPAAMRIEHIRLKARFTLEHGSEKYHVMYLGGNFEFLKTDPRLRVLSFMRIASNVSA